MFVNNGDFYDGKRFGVTTFMGCRSRHFRANLNYQYNEISFPGKGDDLLANGLPRCTTLDCAFITRVVRLSLEGDLLVAPVVGEFDSIRQRQPHRSA